MVKLKRCLSALMAVAMLFSLLYLPANAEDEYRTEKIQLSLQFLDEQQKPMESGVSAGSQFVVALHFSGNPTNAEATPNGITSVALYIQYDSAVATPKTESGYIKKGSLISGSGYNPTIADNAAFIGWMSNDGILDKEDEQCESGVMSNFYYTAAQDASLEQLANAIKIVRTAIVQENGSPVEKSSKLTDFNRKEFPLDLGEPDTKTYEVKFDGNGATGGSMPNQSFPNGAAANLNENKYAKEGSTFAGWAEAAAGEVKYADKAQFTPAKEGVTTLYAQWTPIPKTYEVKFDGNGATGGSMPNQSFPNGAAANLNENQYTKDSSTFAGWAEAAAGEVKYADKAQFTPAKEGVTTLYAQWTPIPKTYEVKFDGNGATGGSMPNQSFPNGAAANLNKNQYTKEGSTFAGWAEAATGEVKYADEAQFTPAKEGVTTLYAQWNAPDNNITITVTCTPTEGGTAVPSKTTAQSGDKIELEVTPNTQGGYVLDGTPTATDAQGPIEVTRSNAMTSGSSITYTFTVRTSNVNVEAKFVKTDPHKINILPSVPEEGGTVTSDKPDNIAVTNEEVTLTVTPDLTKGYVLKELTVTGSDGTKTTPQMKENSNTTYAFSEYSFKMPDSDVDVQAEFGIPRLVNLPAQVEHGSVSSDKQPTAYVGDTVTLTVEPETGYQLKADFPKVTKADGTAVTLTKTGEKTYSFVMENSDAAVSAEFEAVPKKEVTVTYAPGEGSGDSRTTTEQLPFKLPGNPGFTPPSGKSFDGWTLPDGRFFSVDAEIGESDLSDNSIITAHYKTNSNGCYVATAVYGSYDCPEVWTLRRFRDDVLAETWYGRLFIKLYYAVSPTAVKLFGDADWFQNFWRGKLDDMVSSLREDGFESTPYQDKDW